MFKKAKQLFQGWKLKLLKFLAFVGTLAVFGCMQAVSISHTLALAQSHQYQGWEAIAFVVGVEIAFVVGLLLIILDRAQGRRLNLGTIVFFFIPSLVVGAANWRSGAGFGWTGVALGLVPPSLVLAVEKVLTNTSTSGEKAPAKTTSWWSRIFKGSTTSAPTPVITSASMTEHQRQPMAPVTTSKAPEEYTSTSEQMHQRQAPGATSTSGGETPSASKNTSASTNTGAPATSAKQTAARGDRDASEPEHQHQPQIFATSASEESTSTPAPVVTSTKYASATTRESASTTDHQDASTSDTRRNTSAPAASRSTTTSTRKNEVGALKEDRERARKVALAIFEETGELPGRPRLKTEASCRENVAKTTLNNLKKEIGIGKVV